MGTQKVTGFDIYPPVTIFLGEKSHRKLAIWPKLTQIELSKKSRFLRGQNWSPCAHFAPEIIQNGWFPTEKKAGQHLSNHFPVVPNRRVYLELQEKWEMSNPISGPQLNFRSCDFEGMHNHLGCVFCLNRVLQKFTGAQIGNSRKSRILAGRGLILNFSPVTGGHRLEQALDLGSTPKNKG